MTDKDDYKAWDGLLLNMADNWSYKYGLDKGECYSELLLAYGLALKTFDESKSDAFGPHFYVYRQNALTTLIKQSKGISDNELSIDSFVTHDDIEATTDIEDAITLVLFEMDLANLDKELVKVLDYIRDRGIIQNATRNRIGKKTLKRSLMADLGWTEHKAIHLIDSFGHIYREYCVA